MENKPKPWQLGNLATRQLRNSAAQQLSTLATQHIGNLATWQLSDVTWKRERGGREHIGLQATQKQEAGQHVHCPDVMQDD
jgi:hypothetical protein